MSEQLNKIVEEIGLMNDESVSKVSSNVLFTTNGVYLRKVPISQISSILVDLRKKMDPDFSFNITTEGEFAEIFLSEDQLLYWAKKTRRKTRKRPKIRTISKVHVPKERINQKKKEIKGINNIVN